MVVVVGLGVSPSAKRVNNIALCRALGPSLRCGLGD